MHLASFGQKDNADRAEAKLKAAGLPAFVRPAVVNSKTYYRLMVGRFQTGKEARAFGQDIEKRGLAEGLGPFQIKTVD